MNKVNFSFIVFFLFMMTNTHLSAQAVINEPIEWQLAAQLENADGTVSTGFAGAINSVCGNVLIVAGGANFPDKMPWEGGKKHYSDEIHILEKKGEKFAWHKQGKLTLPEPIAYCGNTSTPFGVVYAGGENDRGLSNKAFLLKWDIEKEQLIIKQLPNLPLKVTNVALTSINSVVYAVGGDEQNNSSTLFCFIDLQSHNPQWQPLPRLPLALANTTTVVQKGADGYSIFIIGGRSKTPSQISSLHHTVFEYKSSKLIWKRLADISDGECKMNFSAGAAIPFGDHHILILGGDNGVVFHQIETYLSKITLANTPAEKEQLISEKNELITNHKGFYKGLLLYNTYTNRWTKAGELPFAAQVTTTATLWGDDVVLSNGEVKPGVRTPDVMLGKILISEKDAE
jgi:N-acetylneuraminate epimerase